MREADVREVEDGTGHSIEDALRWSYASSGAECWAMTAENIPVAIFGVAPHHTPLTGVPDGIVGNPWLLGTDDMRLITRDFVIQTPDWVDLMQCYYPYLVNWVDDRNEVSKNWLKWCGFRLVCKEPFGPKQLPFWRFERIREPCAPSQ